MGLLSQGVWAQTDNWDYVADSPLIEPAPLLPVEFGGTGEHSFYIGNVGLSVLPFDADDRSSVTISLDYGEPLTGTDPAGALGSISGVANAQGDNWFDFFNWEYLPASNTFRGTQKDATDLPGGSKSQIKVQYTVTQNSFEAGIPQNGFLAQWQPSTYTAGINVPTNDFAKRYTYVEAKDYGDAPAASYGEAWHIVDLETRPDGRYLKYSRIGSVVDPEDQTQSDALAVGDDTSQSGGLGSDDEDGVVFPEMNPGDTAVPINVTLYFPDSFMWTSFLHVWIDWDRSGTFEGAERVYISPSATRTSGVVTVPVDVPVDAAKDMYYYARFRLGPEANVAGDDYLGPTGGADWGEVEDHIFLVGDPTSATIDDFGTTMESVDEFLSMFSDPEALLALLARYDSDLATDLKGADDGTIMKALKSILDPDGNDLLAVVRWDTLEERGTAGFYLERKAPGDDDFTYVSKTLLAGLIYAPHGGQYWLADPGVSGKGTYSYRLVEQEARGTQRTYGPWQVRVGKNDQVKKVKNLSKKAKRRSKKHRVTDDGFSEWKVLGKGYGARKRKAKRPKFEKVVARLNAKLKAQGVTSRSSTNWLYTDQAGLYRLTVAELSGFTGLKKKKVRRLLKRGDQDLVYENQSVPYYFDAASDALYFVGEAYNTLYTDENAYYLTSASGEQMPADRGRGPKAGMAGGEFAETLTLEKDLTYAPWVVNGDAGADYWFWDYIYASSVDNDPNDPLQVNLAIPTPAASGQVELRIYIQGATDFVEGDDHHVNAWLNGTWLGEVKWDGLAEKVLEANVAPGLLLATGNNTLELTSEVSGPWQWLNRVEVRYQRQLTAHEGSLWVDDLPAGTYTVTGFDSEAIRVIEAPGTAEARWRNDITVSPATGVGYQVSFEADQSADYLVVQADAALTPRVAADQPSSLKRRRNRADYLIIAPRELGDTAAALAAYRSERFAQVKIAWLEDIYDEFTFGRVDAGALYNFLAHVHHSWRRVPEYVVLLGKGTVDHRDRLGYSESLVPVQMTSTPWGLYQSDNRYGDVDDDGVSEFALGRIPVTIDSEGLAYVEKLRRFEGSKSGVWTSRAVVSADNPDKAGDFHANSDQIMADLNAQGYTVDHAYHSVDPEDPMDAVRDILTASATWDSAYVNYVGHGALTQLGTEGFLTSADVAELNNTGLPVFAALTCSVGNDVYPGFPSLTGELVRHDTGGAVAALAPTGLSLNEDAHLLNREFVNGLTAKGQSLGDAWRISQDRAKAAVAPFMLEIYQVIGDPAVQLP